MNTQYDFRTAFYLFLLTGVSSLVSSCALQLSSNSDIAIYPGTPQSLKKKKSIEIYSSSYIKPAFGLQVHWGSSMVYFAKGLPLYSNMKSTHGSRHAYTFGIFRVTENNKYFNTHELQQSVYVKDLNVSTEIVHTINRWTVYFPYRINKNPISKSTYFYKGFYLGLFLESLTSVEREKPIDIFDRKVIKNRNGPHFGFGLTLSAFLRVGYGE